MCEEEGKWLEEVESTLADLRPLAGSVAITKTQKDENEVRCTIKSLFYNVHTCSLVPRNSRRRGRRPGNEATYICMYTCAMLQFLFTLLQRLNGEVGKHRKKMESVLSSLETLASHDKILDPSPVTDYADKLRYIHVLYMYVHYSGTPLIRTP